MSADFHMTQRATIQVGSKTITLELAAEDQVIARCPCTRLKSEVQVPLTPAQATELFVGSSRSIAQVLPDHPPALREIFITGTTPAEWDATFRRRLRPANEYRAMGYAPFDEAHLMRKARLKESVGRRTRTRVF